jgi:hypothetical protein
MPNINAIRVWSVWQAESFYKSLGFRNVYTVKSKDSLPSKIEGKHGPLLAWVSEVRKKVPQSTQSVSDNSVSTIRSVESLPNMKSNRSSSSLKSKDSKSSLRGGVGAYYCN